MSEINLDSFRHSIEKMKEKGILFDKGLSAEELAIVENRYSIRFPPDLRAFYELGLPISRGEEKLPNFEQENYPNWRSNEDKDEKFVRFYLDWPVDMLQWDVEHKDLWITDWGERPEDIPERREKTAEFVRKAPRLIPIHGHKFIPQEPHETNNPIFSMYGFDTVYWAENLGIYWMKFDRMAGYLHKEDYSKVKIISFWDDLIRMKQVISYRNIEGK